jgi:sulfoxide reductase catalytic subunit YedY
MISFDDAHLYNALKPECLLAYEMNGKPLTVVYGAPLRLRVENQLGYRMVKWIERIEFVESEKALGKGEGGKNEDDESPILGMTTRKGRPDCELPD